MNKRHSQDERNQSLLASREKVCVLILASGVVVLEYGRAFLLGNDVATTVVFLL